MGICWYWVYYIVSYLWEEMIHTLGYYYQKRQSEGETSNIQRCLREDIFTKGNFSYLSFTLQFPLPLHYMI